MRKNSLFIILLIWILFGCKVKEGIIVDKSIEPPEETLIYIPQYVQQGNTSQSLQVPYKVYDQEDHVITIETTKGKSRTFKIYLKANCYHEVKIGDHWTPDNCSSYTDFNNYQEPAEPQPDL